MNKYLNNFVVQNNWTNEGKFWYGDIYGYQAFIKYDSLAMPALSCGICANFKNHVEDIHNYLKENKKQLKIIKWEVKDNYVEIYVMMMTWKIAMTNIETVLKNLSEHLTTLQINNALYCPVCDSLFQDKALVHIDNIPMFVDAECQKTIEIKNEEEKKEWEAVPNNYLKGTLGAILGALVGCICWIAIGAGVGFISGWIAFLIAYLAGFGYDKMKGKANATKLGIVIAITLVSSVLSTFIVYIILTYKAMSDLNLYGSPFQMLFQLIEINDDVRFNFILDLVLSLGFGIFGSFIAYAQMKKKIKY